MKKALFLGLLVIFCLSFSISASAAIMSGFYSDIGDGEWREYWMDGGGDGTPAEGEIGNQLWARDSVAGLIYVEKSLDLSGILSYVDYGTYEVYTTLYTGGQLRVGSDIWDVTDPQNYYNSNDVYAIVTSTHYDNGARSSTLEMWGTFVDDPSLSLYVTADVVFSGFDSIGDSTPWISYYAGDSPVDTPYAYGTLENVNLSIPEPATMFLFGTGLLGLSVIGRKRFLKK